MTDPVLWTLVFFQMLMGLFDVLYHHEFTERLPWRPQAKKELVLHSVRNGFYAFLFFLFAWFEPKGVFATLVIVILLTEVAITLWDFVEEDLTRKLPATERITHTLLAINFGAILAFLLPILYQWSGETTGLSLTFYGFGSLVLVLASIGVLLFAIKDYLNSKRIENMKQATDKELAEGLEGKQNILITGATGFIGSRLTKALLANGHQVTVLTRRPDVAAELGAPLTIITDLKQVTDDAKFDSIINLAGESVAGGLWTDRRRRKIIASRVNMTNNLNDMMARLPVKPENFINASATGWYGMRGDEILSEEDPGVSCFAHEVCKAREEASNHATELGVRVVNLRIGLVFGSQGGALGQMLPAFDLGGGGPLGDGQQWMSWIERDDMVRLIVHTMRHKELSGAVNAVAPNPVRNEDFAQTLGKVLHRPAFMRLPAGVLRAVAGELADELLLRGQRVSSEKVVKSGFKFRHSTLKDALEYATGM